MSENTDLHAQALQAVADADPNAPAGRKLDAIRILRNATRGNGARHTLRDLKEAVEWALARPGAASLPVGSVVATSGRALVKAGAPDDPEYPWRWGDALTATNEQIDALIHGGYADVLRVGSGGRP